MNGSTQQTFYLLITYTTMASFLEKLINNATNSMSEGIKKRVEDGTFNRMASDFGRDISSLGAGMVSIVNMAENAFGKLKGKVTDAKTKFEEHAERRQAEKEEREREYAEERARRLAALEQKRDEGQSNGDVTDNSYVPGVTPVDDYFVRVAKLFELNDDEIKLYGLARLTVKTSLFFANCDGDYTKRERECVEDFKDMIAAEMVLYEVEDENGETIEFNSDVIFDNIEQAYTIDDIIRSTHRLVDDMSEDDRRNAIDSIDYLVSDIVKADKRNDTRTEDFYDLWRQEFGLI